MIEQTAEEILKDSNELSREEETEFNFERVIKGKLKRLNK